MRKRLVLSASLAQWPQTSSTTSLSSIRRDVSLKHGWPKVSVSGSERCAIHTDPLPQRRLFASLRVARTRWPAAALIFQAACGSKGHNPFPYHDKDIDVSGYLWD